jgi:hypothetical protein
LSVIDFISLFVCLYVCCNVHVDYIILNGRTTWWIMNSKTCGRKQLWRTFMHHAAIFLKELRKSTKISRCLINISHSSWRIRAKFLHRPISLGFFPHFLILLATCFDPEDRGNFSLRIVGSLISDYEASQPRLQLILKSHMKIEIWRCVIPYLLKFRSDLLLPSSEYECKSSMENCDFDVWRGTADRGPNEPIGIRRTM